MNKNLKLVIEVLFSLFIGIMFVFLVSSIIDIIFPDPLPFSELNGVQQNNDKSFYGGIISLIVGLSVMTTSLFIPHKLRVIENGLLSGGVFTVLYGMSSFNTYGNLHPIANLLFILVTLVFTCVIGWFKFSRESKKHNSNSNIGTSDSNSGTIDLEERVVALEQKMKEIKYIL